MNVVVVIKGREAIPVRAIPFLTEWLTLSPDAIVKQLAGQTRFQRISGLKAYTWADGKVKAIPAAMWWQDRYVPMMKVIESDIRAQGEDSDIAYLRWQLKSLKALPAGAFVWKDEFESKYYRAYRLQEEASESIELLDFDIAIPEFETRRLVMQGFRPPEFVDDGTEEAKASTAVMALSAALRATPIAGKRQAEPVVATEVSDDVPPMAAKNRRRDLVAHRIEEAQKQVGDQYDTSKIWLALKAMANLKTSPFLGVSDEGLKWVNSKDETKFLTLGNLRDRLSRQNPQRIAAIERAITR